MPRSAAGIVVVAAALGLAQPQGGVARTAFAATPAAAADRCLVPGPLPPARRPLALRFGITPQLAGSAGASQVLVAPESRSGTLAALRGLRPPGRELVLRLNRMFWSDGAAGIARYAALVDRYAAAGFRTEVQVRYHPPPGHEDDLAGWLAYVRRAVRTFARRPSVVELTITNEGNLPVSPNTSDGAFAGVVPALVRGIETARIELDRRGRRDMQLGFTYAHRWTPDADAAFFAAIGRASTPGFRRALDHVGLQLYPGLFVPPVTSDAAGDVVDALTLLRTCWMPQAGLGRRVAIWITELGYATRGGSGAPRQAADLMRSVAAVRRVSGTLGVRELRWFNLRDNRSTGPDLFDAVGLLTDSYRRKPAFAALRAAIRRYGTRAPVRPARRSAPVRASPGSRSGSRCPRAARARARR